MAEGVFKSEPIQNVDFGCTSGPDGRMMTFGQNLKRYIKNEI